MTEAAPAATRALLLDNDLFFVVKVTETLKHLGMATTTARRLEDFLRALPPAADAPTLALVNTAARGVAWQQAIQAARAAGVPVVAYGAHVDLATQEEARRAGATRVISNATLASDLPRVVARALRPSTTPHSPGARQTATETEPHTEPL